MISGALTALLQGAGFEFTFDHFRQKRVAKESELDLFVEEQSNPERRDKDKWLHLSKTDATYAIAKVLDLTIKDSFSDGLGFIQDLILKHGINLKEILSKLKTIQSPILFNFSQGKQ
jgi:hypothetical protein